MIFYCYTGFAFILILMADDQGSTGQQPIQPPRPGDLVPEGGLDPTQVFASPPPPPPVQGAGAGTGVGDDDQGTASQDSGPPPPEVGTEATKEMGFDDEDIRVLGEVGSYRFGTITAALSNEHIVVPAHPETTFDESQFLSLLRGSISLTRDEKWRIIQSVPKLSQFQIDELQKILDEERRKFSELSPKHLSQLMRLEQKHSEDWRDLQSLMVQKGAKQEEQSQVDDIRKQLGL